VANLATYGPAVLILIGIVVASMATFGWLMRRIADPWSLSTPLLVATVLVEVFVVSVVNVGVVWFLAAARPSGDRRPGSSVG
jgi:hypothetical protein